MKFKLTSKFPPSLLFNVKPTFIIYEMSYIDEKFSLLCVYFIDMAWISYWLSDSPNVHSFRYT